VNLQLVGEQLFNGLVLGSMYALVASGLSLVWGSLKMINFAHADFYMLGAFAIYFLFAVFGLPVLVAIPLALLVVLAVGALTERLTIHPLLNKPGWDVNPIVATVGLSIFLQNFALRMWGERFQNVPYFSDGTFVVAGMRMANQRLIILGVAILAVVAGAILLKRTWLGMSLRATALDRDAAVLSGVNVHGVYTWAVSISAALAALAGAMLAPIFSVNPWMGTMVLLKCFVICVLGGLGRLEGAILGAILYGTVESMTVVFWSSEWKDVTAFALLLAVLWFRPNGLLGTKEW
jgi:branched-chain amino acid transport system permease protein